MMVFVSLPPWKKNVKKKFMLLLETPNETFLNLMTRFDDCVEKNINSINPWWKRPQIFSKTSLLRNTLYVEYDDVNSSLYYKTGSIFENLEILHNKNVKVMLSYLNTKIISGYTVQHWFAESVFLCDP